MGGMQDIATIVVPQWYREAKSQGASEAMLREKIKQFLIEALAHRSSATPHAVDDNLVTITFDMYEHAMRQRQEEA
jgi:hypothetical protein